MIDRVSVLDTTLRDGAQREGISFSVKDKLSIAHKLDEFGIAYIEGGFPGSNPKDDEFFVRAKSITWRQARLVAFGSTRKAHVNAAEDSSLRALLEAETPTVAIVGKSSRNQVQRVLNTALEENLRMIADSVALFRQARREVLFDAEHFFDGYKQDQGYALETLKAAFGAGADFLVLCDTNGGSLPHEISQIVKAVCDVFPQGAIGIHAHNDTGVAVANTLMAVLAGAVHVQGTMNGYGERCGNADLCAVIPNLELKLGYSALDDGRLPMLAEAARYISEISNLIPDEHAPYVGASAFAHKAGLHVSALRKDGDSYQHVAPERVGNQMRVLVSELAGRRNIAAKLCELNLANESTPEEERTLTQQLKQKESQGFQYEGADGSFELLVRRNRPGYKAPFEVLDFLVLVEKRVDKDILAEATVKARVGKEIIHTAAEGHGPVNALDTAMRKALLHFYPELESIHLTDYKVRIIDQKSASAAFTRVLIDASDGERTWTTVGCSENIIDASFQALIDSLELPLLRRPS
ncbi:MAG: citramalate synthase [Anaerolineae bacterium]